jgi:hypothetical protein
MPSLPARVGGSLYALWPADGNMYVDQLCSGAHVLVMHVVAWPVLSASMNQMCDT